MEHGGGPFGAVVYNGETGEIIAPGVNLVMPQACSLLHAGSRGADVRAGARAELHARQSQLRKLFANSEPCVQCLGACHWAGLSRLVCGASVAQAEALGFDEGPRATDWKEQLALRGTPVLCDVQAAAAGAVLSSYAAAGGFRYNARTPALG